MAKPKDNHKIELEAISTYSSCNVVKVVDRKPCETSKDGFCYRVRWKDAPSSQDTWEPWQSFYQPRGYDSRSLVLVFNERYRQMLEKDRAAALSSGLDPPSVDDVNIFSREISRIVAKTTLGQDVYFKVEWEEDHPTSWEPDVNLLHAKDKLAEFNIENEKKKEKRRIQNRNIAMSSAPTSPSDLQEKKRKERDRLFWESFQKGQDPLVVVDLYTKVKRRMRTPTRNKTTKNPKLKHELESSEDGNMNARPSSLAVNSPPPRSWVELNGRYRRLSPYNADNVRQELARRRQKPVNLTAGQFEDAVESDDFEVILRCVEGGKIPTNVDVVRLFLASVRRGLAGTSALLATRLPNLSVTDEYGDDPVVAAASRGHLLLGRILLEMNAGSEDGARRIQALSHGKYAHFVRLCWPKANSAHPICPILPTQTLSSHGKG